MTASPPKRRRPPFSIRFSFEEKTLLMEAADGLPVAEYIKSLLFSELAPRIAPKRRSPVKDHKALAEVLACLGASRIPNNLNQLAKHANSGSLYLDRETKAQLSGACADIRVMRQLLMVALGMRVDAEPVGDQSTAQSFARATGRFQL